MRIIIIITFVLINFLVQTQPPTANFLANSTQICLGAAVTFTDLSTAGGSPITGRAWDFGDGKTSLLQDPSNTYVFPGTYSAGLSIVDEYGCVSDTVLVDYLTIFGPTGDPFWNTVADLCGQTYDFGVNNQVNVTNVIWNLGDGTTLGDTNDFSYTYGTYNTFNPTATLVDDLGCQVLHELPPITIINNGLNAVVVPSPSSGPMELISHLIISQHRVVVFQ